MCFFLFFFLKHHMLDFGTPELELGHTDAGYRLAFEVYCSYLKLGSQLIQV